MQSLIVFLLAASAQALHIPIQKRATSSYSATTFAYEPVQTGYVAFGDSYAAGVGAGRTTGDSCRVGANAYPAQLNTWIKGEDSGIDYQAYACSGAKTPELLQGAAKSQIDKWTAKSDRATISIGGNDVGFYNVLTACVLRVGQVFAGDCDTEVNKAYDTINSADFSNNIDKALRQIIAKSGRNDFKIVQTGYPTFFDDTTDICDYSTFYFWQPGHHGIHRPNFPYLYKALRTKLNKLVEDLNSKLQDIVDGVNKDFTETRVLFADPNPAFNGHRFCEKGVQEPDSSNAENWFFLASWPDKTPGDEASDANEAGVDISTQAIPDAATCADSSDWADLTLCGMARAGIIHTVDGKTKVASNLELPDGTNVTIQDVSWWTPTNYVKTFHPRSTGHRGVRDLVRGTW